MNDKQFHFQKIDDPIGLAEQIAEQKKAENQDISKYFVDFTQDIQRPTAVIRDPRFDDVILASEQNLFVIAGEAKSRKSYLMTMMASFFFAQNVGKKCIYIDTEQGDYNVIKIARRICRSRSWRYEQAMEDGLFKMARLRPYPADERLKIVEKIIDQERPYLCIIDGARDLVRSVNDDIECMALVDKFLKWTEEYNMSIGTVIHTNKDKETLRGHLGSELINKSETVLFCKADPKTNRTNVTCTYSRNNAGVEPFSFEIRDDGLPYMVEVAEHTPEDNQRKNRRLEVFDMLPVIETNKAEWVREIRTKTGVSDGTARNYIAEYISDGLLLPSRNSLNLYGHFRLYVDLPKQDTATQQEIPISNSLDDGEDLPF